MVGHGMYRAGVAVNQVADTAITQHGAMHDAWELSRLTELVYNVIRPELVLEIGSWVGGSLYAWRALGCAVVAVTLPVPSGYTFESHGAEVILGDSHDLMTATTLAATLGGRRPGFVLIDGDHTEDGAQADLDLVTEIAPGAVVAMHDVNLHHRVLDCGVRWVWERAAASRPHMLIENDQYTDPGVGILWPPSSE